MYIRIYIFKIKLFMTILSKCFFFFFFFFYGIKKVILHLGEFSKLSGFIYHNEFSVVILVLNTIFKTLYKLQTFCFKCKNSLCYLYIYF